MAKDPAYKRCKCRGHDGKEVGPDCPKLRRADGSWNPRHGTWYFSLELPAGPGGRRRSRMRRGGFTNRDDALAAYEEARAQIRRGADPSSRVTTGRYLEEWLATRVDLKRTTRRNYRLVIETYLVPLLGHMELIRLQAGDISDAFATIREWNAALADGKPVRKSQRHVGPEAMQRIRAVLRVALNDAVDEGKLAFNPAARKRVRMEATVKRKPLAWTPSRVEAFWVAYRQRIATTKLTRGDRNWRCWRNLDLRPAPSMVWTPQQAGEFRAAVEGDRFAELYELIMLTGIRRGESLGLKWVNVDLDRAELLIGPSRVQAGWEVSDEEPKSEAGLRPVVLDKVAVSALRRHKAQQASDRLAWGEAWQGTGLVFTLEDGSAPHPDLVTSTFERRAFAAGLPPVRIHDLRHGWATYALAGGVDIKIVQERLGHSSSKITRDTYTTVLDEVARQAAQTVSDMIPRVRRRG